jgi:hypothetical protein
MQADLFLFKIMYLLCWCHLSLAAVVAVGGRSRNRELQELFQSGIGLHHAGMLRSDRNLTERLFSDGFIKVTRPVNRIMTHS